MKKETNGERTIIAEPDLHELLTTAIDQEMEAYLRRQGLGWLFARRQRYQDFLKQHEATEYG